MVYEFDRLDIGLLLGKIIEHSARNARAINILPSNRVQGNLPQIGR